MAQDKRITAHTPIKAQEGIVVEVGESLLVLSPQDAQRLVETVQQGLNALWLAEWKRVDPTAAAPPPLHVLQSGGEEKP